MGSKHINNPIELRVVVHFDPNGDHINTAKVCYTAACEHDINEARMLLLQHVPKLCSAVHDLAEEAIAQVDAHEQIPEEDSLSAPPA